jgi:hypothetical protein
MRTLKNYAPIQIWWGRRLTVSELRCQDGTAQNGTVKMVLARSIPIDDDAEDASFWHLGS